MYAEREVILCGGTYNSAQLLMLSGFGAADELRRLGIRVQADLPGVGANLSEHLRAGLQFATREPVTFLRELRADRVAISLLRWLLFGTGAFAAQVSSCNVVIRTDDELRQPDIQIMCNPVRMDAKVWWPLMSRRQAHLLTADAVLLHPQIARAREPALRRSVRQAAHPVQCPRRARRPRHAAAGSARRAPHLRHERRRRTSSSGRSCRAPRWPAMRTSIAYIRANAGVTQHPVGTCSMAPGPGRVVDAQLRVQGVDGLRVADASIMPTVPGGNTYGAVLMIAERAADLIRGRTLPPQLERT